MYESFQTDKTKVSKWLKNKVEFVKAAVNMEKYKLLKICTGLKYFENSRKFSEKLDKKVRQ